MALPALNHAPEGAAAQANAEKALLARDKFQYSQMLVLRESYLKTQTKMESPWNTLVRAAAAIMAVATVIFSELATFPALVVGFAVYAMTVGIGEWLIKQNVDQTYRDAAEALLVPEFYSDAVENEPRHLSTPAKVLAAFKEWKEGRDLVRVRA